MNVTGFTITYPEYKNNAFVDILDSVEVNVDTYRMDRGYYIDYSPTTVVPGAYANSIKIALHGKRVKLDYTELADSGAYVGYIQYQDDSVEHLTKLAGTYSKDIVNGKYLMLNFWDGEIENYKLTKLDEQLDCYVNNYEDYVNDELNFDSSMCLFVGDSITKGFTDGETITANNYPYNFCNKMNCTQINIALGGALYTSGYNSVATLLEQLTNYTGDKSSIDFIFLLGGASDFQLKADLDAFKTAVSDTIDYALNNYPNAKIIVITPINNARSNMDLQLLFKYRNIITEVALLKDDDRISIVQGYKFNLPLTNNSASFISSMYGDKTHPTEYGYKVLANCLIKALTK